MQNIKYIIILLIQDINFHDIKIIFMFIKLTKSQKLVMDTKRKLS